MVINKGEYVELPLDLIDENVGQIDGVPANPRKIGKTAFAKLCKRLKENNLIGVQPLKVYELDGRYVVLGGNQRLKALRTLKTKCARCIVVPPDTPAKVLREIVIIDNHADGADDWDLLVQDWATDELHEWGGCVAKYGKNKQRRLSKYLLPTDKRDVRPCRSRRHKII